MTILASIMPGFRDIRSQFVVGAIWIAAITLALIPIGDNLGRWFEISALTETWKLLPESVKLGIAATVVYLLGMAVPVWVAAILTRLRSILVKVILDDPNPLLPDRWNRIRAAIAKRLNLPRKNWYPPSGSSNGLISVAIRNSIPNDTDELVASLLGPAVALAEIDLAALRLSKDLPEQYQQYDRIRSEGAIRTSIAPALAAVCFASSFYTSNAVLGVIVCLVGVAVATTISSQGHALRLEAESLIATALYLQWTTTPTIDAISADLRALHAAEKTGVSHDLDCILSHLSDMHNELVTDWVVSRMRHPSRTSLVNDPDADKVLRKYALRGIPHPFLSYREIIASQGSKPSLDSVPENTVG